jgi:hypothetical protein
MTKRRRRPDPALLDPIIHNLFTMLWRPDNSGARNLAFPPFLEIRPAVLSTLNEQLTKTKWLIVH